MTQSLSPKNGGTGTKTEPDTDDILVGAGDGTYTLRNFSIGATEPVSPNTNDLWIDTN